MSVYDRIQIEARSDSEDRLISADEPLATLQARCGGKLPGAIAIPELRELVAKSRGYGLKLARPITAQDGVEVIRAWIEVSPLDGGCRIILRNWHATPLPPEPSDLTGRRKAEIDRALAELTARLDAGQNVLTVECEASDLMPVAKAMQAGIGRPWTDFVELGALSSQKPLHWRLLDGAEVIIKGSQRPWRASVLPQLGLEGETLGFELFLTSEVPMSGSDLVPEDQADQTVGPPKGDKARSALIGRELAPILRLPIARIIANAETIRTRRVGPLPEEYADYAGDIAAAGQHLLALIDDLSDMEVIEAEGFAPAADRIDLADLARRAAGILGVRAREKGITLQLPDVQEHLPAIGEFRRVLQVLLNLIGNAIRYTPENSTVSLQLTSCADRARIAVVDQGAGLSAEEASRVFNKFERLGRSGDGGSGLGLYISRRLARAMGGELTVESRLGHGTRFTLDLPKGG
ncbi:HAMP domain-containing histidine kinase [Novosphingobium umbonatum]|uniref:histidine kinase n=1 Tax=Novosphingobium umbonatum TaxID=1908524 RepID=A0A3S2VRH1_9SPHN|nr:HAMP domain-containing sensor histidine kinase [Novosphingobium umbonatum]RVU03792.1 HAMP domain-containing histidine kinase [Novosphingobium umbonatum]